MTDLPSNLVEKQRRVMPPPPPVESFMGRHNGQVCAILANGETLGLHDLSLLKCVTLGVNHSWDRHWSDYHVIADYSQYMRYAASHAKLLAEGRLYERIAKPGLNYFDEQIAAGRLFTVGTAPLPGSIKLQMHTKNRIGGRTPDAFSLDITTGIRVGIRNIGSAAYVALQVAVSMGCDPVYMLGLDLHGNHYHGEWDGNPEALRQQDELFGYARAILEAKHGGKPTIYVCGSEKSRCTQFPKVPYSHLLEAQEK